MNPWLLLLPIGAVLLSFGWLVVFGHRPGQKHNLLLAFSGAFLLAVTLMELLPEAYALASPKMAGLLIVLGILLQILLETFSKGAEHGHVHGAGELKVFPWLLLISLSLHALTEGIPLKHASGFLMGIVVHKIPVSLIIGGFLLRSGLSAKAAWGFMIGFALMTPLGALIGIHPALQTSYTYLLPVVIGVVLHVATIILFESSEGHAFNLRKLGVMLLGVFLAYWL